MTKTINQETNKADLARIQRIAQQFGVDLSQQRTPEETNVLIERIDAQRKQQDRQRILGGIQGGVSAFGEEIGRTQGLPTRATAQGGLSEFTQKELLKRELGRPAAEAKTQEAEAKTIREEEKLSLARAKDKREQEKFEREGIERTEKAEASSALVQESTDELLDAITEVKKGSKFFGLTGPIPAIPGLQDEKVLWQANLDKLLAKRILALMTKLKSASRTGATGFGQLSEKELKVLQDGSTALKKTLSEQDALDILNTMEEKLLKIKTGGQNIQGGEGLPTTAQGQGANADIFDDLL